MYLTQVGETLHSLCRHHIYEARHESAHCSHICLTLSPGGIKVKCEIVFHRISSSSKSCVTERALFTCSSVLHLHLAAVQLGLVSHVIQHFLALVAIFGCCQLSTHITTFLY